MLDEFSQTRVYCFRLEMMTACAVPVAIDMGYDGVVCKCEDTVVESIRYCELCAGYRLDVLCNSVVRQCLRVTAVVLRKILASDVDTDCQAWNVWMNSHCWCFVFWRG